MAWISPRWHELLSCSNHSCYLWVANRTMVHWLLLSSSLMMLMMVSQVQHRHHSFDQPESERKIEWTTMKKKPPLRFAITCAPRRRPLRATDRNRAANRSSFVCFRKLIVSNGVSYMERSHRYAIWLSMTMVMIRMSEVVVVEMREQLDALTPITFKVKLRKRL